MTLVEFLFQSVDALRAGDFLIVSEFEERLESAREQLEIWAEAQEDYPVGLEALGDATAEALDSFADSLDLLEMAVQADIPELSDLIMEKTQDALDIFRDVKQKSELHYTILTEELAVKG